MKCCLCVISGVRVRGTASGKSVLLVKSVSKGITGNEVLLPGQRCSILLISQPQWQSKLLIAAVVAMYTLFSVACAALLHYSVASEKSLIMWGRQAWSHLHLDLWWVSVTNYTSVEKRERKSECHTVSHLPQQIHSFSCWCLVMNGHFTQLIQ